MPHLVIKVLVTADNISNGQLHWTKKMGGLWLQHLIMNVILYPCEDVGLPAMDSVWFLRLWQKRSRSTRAWPPWHHHVLPGRLPSSLAALLASPPTPSREDPRAQGGMMQMPCTYLYSEHSCRHNTCVCVHRCCYLQPCRHLQLVGGWWAVWLIHVCVQFVSRLWALFSDTIHECVCVCTHAIICK